MILTELDRTETSVQYVEGSINAEPLTLDEVKNFVRVSADFHDDDDLLNTLIIMARQEAETRTGGRVLPDSVWEISTIDGSPFIAGQFIQIPLSPFRDVIIETETETEGTGTDDDEPTTTEEESIPPFSLVIPSSLAANGRPIYGAVQINEGIELNKIKIRAGWPNKQEERVHKYDNAPVLVYDNIRYDENTIYLQFDRVITGSADSNSFILTVDGVQLIVDRVVIQDGRVLIKLDEEHSKSLQSGDRITMTYVSGFLHDKDSNYVLPIVRSVLPTVTLIDENDDGAFEEVPQPVVDTVHVSQVPDVLKKWMLVRIATVYQQRSEIAIQAGKTSNSFFPRGFIDGLLDPYNIEKA